MTSQQFLVCSNSNATNYVAWASAVSNWLRTAGWTNTADTGQLNGAGANNWAGVSTVPGSGAFYYEIFKPGDALTAFYLKLEYGNFTSQTNSPMLAVSIGTGTDGAGNLTGQVTTRTLLATTSPGSPSATTTYECNFSGNTGQVAVMMWRNSGGNNQQLFAIQRSLNASGVATSSYVTIWGLGYNGGGTQPSGFQQSLSFTYGAGPYLNAGSSGQGWTVFAPATTGSLGTLAFGGNIPMWNPMPAVGIMDYPPTVVGVAYSLDMVEGATFTITNQYGQTKTYMPSKQSGFTHPIGPATLATCMEFD